MRPLSLSRLFKTTRGSKPTNLDSRARRRRQALTLEALEERIALSLTPQMVLDINPTTRSSNPSAMVAIGSTTYFVASDGINGRELWKSDGTAAGTMLIKDIRPGEQGSQVSRLTNVNGTLFFTADDGTTGPGLWKSDGTTAGTVLVKNLDLDTGSDYSNDLINVNGTIFFAAYDSKHGQELWKSDGTAGGTKLVKDIETSAGYGSYPSFLTNVNGTLFFAAGDKRGVELWKSDGTAAGTVLVKDIAPGFWYGSYPTYLTNVNGTLFFTADDGKHGVELWKSNGTSTGTVQVKDILPGGDGSYPESLTSFNGLLYFSADDGKKGVELWKSDGTPAGTSLVKDINVGYDSSAPGMLTNVNGTLFFLASDDTNGRELWKTDGTGPGTTLVKDIRPGSNWSDGDQLTNVNGTLFFSANDGVNGAQLWRSNGTAAGTVIVKYINASGAASPKSLTNVNGTLYFAANDGKTMTELWTSDGTADGTRLVKDINAVVQSSAPDWLTDLNGSLYFGADDGINGRELWKSDGTPAGTKLVKDMRTDMYIGPDGDFVANGSFPAYLSAVNGKLMFSANFQLWRSDGTADGTVPLPATLFSQPTAVGNALYFASDIGGNGMELWKSDGTVSGTTIVKDIYPGGYTISGGGGGYGYYGGGGWSVYYPNSSFPTGLTNVNGVLYFTANDGVNAFGLWKSDGTTDGTYRVDGGSGAFPGSLTNFNGTLYFTAYDPVSGSELWKIDPSTGAAVLVKDIRQGDMGSDPRDLTVVSSTLYFTADNGVNGRELWKSDGTPGGTTLVKDINPGSADSGPINLLNLSGRLYFTADNGVAGRELWASDGTPGGTVLVKNINPGGASSSPGNLTNLNGSLIFTADDGTNGVELWMSDGTTTGTTLLANLNPGNASSSPTSLTISNGTLYFSADDGIHGRELWKLADNAPGTPLPSLSINDVPITEGNSGTKSAVFTVTLSAASNGSVKVNYATANGTATASSDYIAKSGTLSFAAGVTTMTIDVSILGDLLVEPDETFFINLSAPVNATIADAQGQGTIVNDDVPLPTLSIKDVTIIEGNSGTKNALFTVTLSAASTLPITVNYATSDGSATAGTDYTAKSGKLSFAVGVSSMTIAVPILGDLLVEPDETFFLNLSAPTNATLHDAQGLGTIVNDDIPQPTISINDITITEGNSGVKSAVFTVTLSSAYNSTVKVYYATTAGTATAGSDYINKTGTLSFAAGVTSMSVSIPIVGDLVVESDETFFINLSAPVNATIADAQGACTIINDDVPQPTISINDVSIIEGNSGTKNAVFTISLSSAYNTTVKVNYATADGTATAGSDYTAKSGTLSFAAGVTSKTVSVSIFGDLLVEPDETFFLNLSAPVNATISDDQGVGMILNDDILKPSISIDDPTISEGNSGTKLLVFTVSLSFAFDQTVTTSFKTVNGTAKTNNNDYIAQTGTLTFNPGQTTKTISILVQGDIKNEADEVFYVDLFGNSSNSVFFKKRGIGTILNDD